MDIPFESALTGPGPYVAAWDLDGKTEATWALSLFTLERGAPSKLATEAVAHADREAAQDGLRQLGVEVGFFDSGCEHVWAKDDEHFIVWGPDGVAFEADGETARSASGDAVERAHVTGAVAFAGGPRHGVVLETDLGRRVPVAVEGAVSVLGDPFVTRSEVVYEAMWASLLSRQLGKWLGVPSDLQVEGD